MSNSEKLYETLGELIFVIAKADGIIQEEEMSMLDEILSEHPWASTIKWSFYYEMTKNTSPEQAYRKVLDYCKKLGPRQEYKEFISIMKRVAAASEQIDEAEQQVIHKFSKELTAKFMKDIEILKL